MFNSFKISDSFFRDADAVISCKDILELLQVINNEEFRLIVTSPPYNIGKEYEKKTNLEQYLAWQENVIQSLVKVLCSDGSLIWQTGNFVQNGEVFPLDIYFYPIFKKFGLKLRNRIIWHFEHGLHCKNRFSGRYETLLWFTKTDNYIFNLDSVRVPSKYPGKLYYKGAKKGLPSGNPLGKNPSDFWTIIQEEWEEGIIDIPNVKNNHPEKTIHPCQFPVELIERCILACTNRGDWILDPFGGVGSSVIAALKNGRKGMMVEKEYEYTTIAKNRINLLERGELHTRPIGKKIYEPTGKEKISKIPDCWVNNKVQGSLV